MAKKWTKSTPTGAFMTLEWWGENPPFGLQKHPSLWRSATVLLLLRLLWLLVLLCCFWLTRGWCNHEMWTRGVGRFLEVSRCAFLLACCRTRGQERRLACRPEHTLQTPDLPQKHQKKWPPKNEQQKQETKEKFQREQKKKQKMCFTFWYTAVMRSWNN